MPLEILLASCLAAEPLTITTPAPSHVTVVGQPMDITIHHPANPTSVRLIRYAPEAIDGEEITVTPAKDATATTISIQVPLGYQRLTALSTDVEGQQRADIAVAAVPDPGPDNPTSRWGAMTIPDHRQVTDAQAATIARSHRLLGADWSRFPLFLYSFEKIDITDTGIQVTCTSSLKQAKALHEAGVSIMAGFYMVPEVLSSKPGSADHNSDAGPLFCRVRPKDWDQYQKFVENVVAQFSPYVDAWEIGNEVNIGGRYWSDTPESFAEMIRVTAAGIRAADPKALIMSAGFTRSEQPRENSVEFIARMVELQAFDPLQVFTCHGWNPKWAPLLKKAGKDTIPYWNTENHELINLDDFVYGSQRSFHFLHRLPRAELAGHWPLTDQNMVVTPAGVTHAIAADLIGNATYVEGDKAESGQVVVLERDNEQVAVIKSTRRGFTGGQISFTVTPIAGRTVTVIDGQGHPVPFAQSGSTITVKVEGHRFISGAKVLKLAKIVWPQEPPMGAEVVASFANATATSTWGSGPGRGNYTKVEPGPEGHRNDLTFSVPDAGQYAIYFHGTTTWGLTGKRWISPFAWSIDSGTETAVNGMLPSIFRVSTEQNVRGEGVNPPEMFYLGGDAILQHLGTLDLTAGAHQFTIRLTGRRVAPDNGYNLEVHNLIVRKVVPMLAKTVADAGALRDAGATEIPTRGVTIPLINSEFEDGKDGFGAPPGWKIFGNKAYTGGYPTTSGKRCIQIFPDAGTQVELYQVLPAGFITACLGRPIMAGDTFVVQAQAQWYWQEKAQLPALISIGMAADADGNHPGEVCSSQLTGTEVPREQARRFEMRHVVTAEQAAQPVWKLVIGTTSSTQAVGSVLWDAVTVQVVPKP